MQPPQWFHIPRHDNEAAALVVELKEGGFRLEMALTHTGDPLPISALCRSCNKPVAIGMRAPRRDLPLQRAGQWRCTHCGGVATLPEQLVLVDAGTGERIEAIGPDRLEVRMSVITLAELLRLSQAARAVQEGRAGAKERLTRVLDEAPSPIRRLRDRMGPEAWIGLAALLLTLVQILMPLLKDDGQVTERDLLDVIERLVPPSHHDGGAEEIPVPEGG